MIKQSLLWLFLSGFLAACSSTQVQTDTQSSNNMDAEPSYAETSSPNMMKSSTVKVAPTTNNKMTSEDRLGTKWGDDITSNVTQVDLKRLSSKPISETMILYAAKQFQGRSINSISLGAGKINFSVVDDHGKILPLYRDGEYYYLSANDGQSYQLRYTNSSNQTFEIVASVDGLDVLDGSKASRYNSGYVLRPYASFAIEGFRKSNSSVASFTFSKPKDAYAANSAKGSIQNVGVIGTVVYEVKAPKAPLKPNSDGYAPAPNAFPADR